MIKLKLLFLFLFFVSFFKAQKSVIYDKYPLGQDFYDGGVSEFQKDVRKIIREKHLKPCQNDYEKYIASILINSDSSVNFVKDFDTINIQKNKCAYDLSKSFLPYLKNWKPAKIDDKKVNAIAQIMIDPYLLFNKKIKTKESFREDPKFEKGNFYFQSQVKEIIESYIKENISGRRITLAFTITENGALENLKVSNLDISEIKEKELIDDILRIKGKWKPAKEYGVAIKCNLIMNFNQNFNFDLEKQKFENLENSRTPY